MYTKAADNLSVRVIKKNNQTFRVVASKWEEFWNRVEDSSWEPHTYQIFDHFITSDCIFIDIGAWIGPTVLYAAQLAKSTYAFEPDPIAYSELKANLDTNKDLDWYQRIKIYNKAVSSFIGTLKIGSTSHAGDSMSSVLFADESTNWVCETITIDCVAKENNISNSKFFIKMDIEGGEYDLLPNIKNTLAKFNIVLYLSIHPEFLIGSLFLNSKNNVGIKVLRRLMFVWCQRKLLHSLPFKYLYHADGRQVNKLKEYYKAALSGTFIHEIVATNTRW